MDNNTVIIYLGCIIFLFIIGKLFYVPLRYVLKIIINSILGGILLYIINIIGSAFSFHIGINIGTAIIVGVLGIPGAILLIILQLLL